MNNVTLIIGSYALQVAGIQTNRKSYDVDLIARPEDAAMFIKSEQVDGVNYKITYSGEMTHIHAIPDNLDRAKIIDIELAWPDTTALSLLELLEETGKSGVIFASANEIYALKTSHKYKKNSPHFQKTRKDILLLKEHGCKIPAHLKDWWKDRVRETYNYKHPRLKGVSKGEFFNDDGINYVYDHDAIHEVVKNLDKPAYRFFQPEGEEVHTSKEEFHAQPKYVKLYAVLEESYVLSLERAIIPFNLFGDEAKCRKAFETALEKVSTSITSGWFRKYAYDNFDAVNALYDSAYVTRFKAAADRGEVAPYTKKEMA